MKEIDIQFPSEEEHNRLRAIRDNHGITWRGMVIQGAKQLVSADLRQSLALTDPVDSEAFNAAFWRPDGGCSDGTIPSDGIGPSDGAPSDQSHNPADADHIPAAPPGHEQSDRQDADENGPTGEKTETGRDAIGDNTQSSMTDTAEDDVTTTTTQDSSPAGEHPRSFGVDRSPRAERDPFDHDHPHDP